MSWSSLLALLLTLLLFSSLASLTASHANAKLEVLSDQAGSAQIIKVPAGGDLQAALNQARPGDTIVLQANATYVGNFRLPTKAGDAYITITTSALGALPSSGTRVEPSLSRYMPKLVSPNPDYGIVATNGAHHYKFVGIEFHPSAGVYVYGLVRIGLGEEQDLTLVPHDFVFDRVYVHGDPAAGAKAGITLNGASVTVEDSYISDIKGVDQDTQALVGYNGPGPFHIVNNYLEAAGENMLFGGANAAIQDLVPSDIEIRHNYFYKPVAWRQGDPSYAGTFWQVKNLFELKMARRVRVDGNIFENNWAGAQQGFAVLFTPRVSAGGARLPWAVVEDVQFTHNIIRHSAAGFQITGRDDNGVGRGGHILIKDNLLEDISRAHWGGAGGGAGKLFIVEAGTDAVNIDHNTALTDADDIVAVDYKPSTDFVYRNNITPYGRYGIIGSGKSPGRVSIDYFLPGAVISKNAFVGGIPAGSTAVYPPGNFFPRSLEQVGFVNPGRGDYRLASNSRFKNAGTDGKDLGADMEAIAAATRGVVAGSWR